MKSTRTLYNFAPLVPACLLSSPSLSVLFIRMHLSRQSEAMKSLCIVIVPSSVLLTPLAAVHFPKIGKENIMTPRIWTFSHSDILKRNSNVPQLSCIFLPWSGIKPIVPDAGRRWIKALFMTQKLTDFRNCISELIASLRSSSSPFLYTSSSFLSLENKWKPWQLFDSVHWDLNRWCCFCINIHDETLFRCFVTDGVDVSMTFPGRERLDRYLCLG